MTDNATFPAHLLVDFCVEPLSLLDQLVPVPTPDVMDLSLRDKTPGIDLLEDEKHIYVRMYLYITNDRSLQHFATLANWTTDMSDMRNALDTD